MSVFDEKRAELERHEFMMGLERGRLAVALDLLTDALILVGQHGVYCASSRNPSKPALDLQAVLGGMDAAKAADPVGDGGAAKAGREQGERAGGPGQPAPSRCAARRAIQSAVCLKSAPVAQLDRANASGALGREFESLRAHHITSLSTVFTAFFSRSSPVLFSSLCPILCPPMKEKAFSIAASDG